MHVLEARPKSVGGKSSVGKTPSIYEAACNHVFVVTHYRTATTISRKADYIQMIGMIACVRRNKFGTKHNFV